MDNQIRYTDETHNRNSAIPQVPEPYHILLLDNLSCKIHPADHRCSYNNGTSSYHLTIADDLTVLCVRSDCPSALMPEHSMPGSAWYSRAAYEGLRSNVV